MLWRKVKNTITLDRLQQGPLKKLCLVELLKYNLKIKTKMIGQPASSVLFSEENSDDFESFD